MEMKREYPDIPDLEQRLDPGGEVPAGECPKCGCLAFLVEPEEPVTAAQARVFFEKFFNDLPITTVFDEFANALERKQMGFQRLEFPKPKV